MAQPTKNRQTVIGLVVGVALCCGSGSVAAQPTLPSPAPAPDGPPNIFYGAEPLSPPAASNPTVLVFIHGLSGTANTWWTNNNAYQLAFSFGYRTAFIGLNPDNTPNTESVAENAERLRTWLPVVARHYHVDKLVLVGHSKGGVDLQAAMLAPPIRGLVQAVFTLATPNHGTELADWAFGPGLPIAKQLGLLTPGVFSLMTANMARLRAAADPVFRQAGIPFYTLEGSTSLGSPTTTLTGQVLSSLVPHEQNDGFVTVTRAQLPEEYATDLGELKLNHFLANNGDVVMPKIHSVLKGLYSTLSELERIQGNGFGDGSNTWAWSIQWFKGKLYVGTGREITCVTTLTSDVQGNTTIYPLATMGGGCPETAMLTQSLAAEIWQFDPATDEWTRVYKAPDSILAMLDDQGQPVYTGRDIGYRGMTTFIEPDGTEALYVGSVTSGSIFDQAPQFAATGYPPPRILRTTDGTNWSAIPQLPGTFLGDIGKTDTDINKTIRSIRSLTSYKGMLFATAGTFTGVSRVIASANPAAGNDEWFYASPSIAEFPVWEQKVFDNRLYVTTGNKEEGANRGYGVYWTDATGPAPYAWNAVVTAGGYQTDLSVQAPNGLSMAVFKDQLYVGTNRPTELIRINKNGTWDLLVGEPRMTPHGYKTPLTGMGIGFGSWFNGHFWRMVEHGGYLYLGTWDWSLAARFLGPKAESTFASHYGFDLYRSTDGIYWEAVTRSAVTGDMLNIGARSLASTPIGLFIGSARSKGGTELFFCPQPACTVDAPEAALPAPKKLEAQSEELSGRTVVLSWEPSPGAVSYRVYRATANPVTTLIPEDGMIQLPWLPAPVPLDAVIDGVMDFICVDLALDEVCAMLSILEMILPGMLDGIAASPAVLPGGFMQVGITQSPFFTEEAPSPLNSLYYVRAENAAGQLSEPSNFVGGPSKAAAAPVDLTPPVITASVSPAADESGWHNGPVTVTWTVDDPDTGIISSTGCTPTAITEETAGLVVTCSAVNGNSLSATRSVVIRIGIEPGR